MFTKVKTQEEIKSMKEGGKMLASILDLLSQKIEPGMSTKDLSDIAKSELKIMGGIPAFLGYYGFPDVICISINDEVVHGIPRANKKIKSGDLVSIDFGVTYNGMITDSAITVIVGKPILQAHVDLVSNTKESLMAGIMAAHDAVNVGDISNEIEKVLNKHKYGIVRDLVGHGVGHELHEGPNIPNYGSKGTGPKLYEGMTIAIEPMATLGDYYVTMDADNWTMRTADGSLSAHFEHTVLITDKGAEILTQA